MPKKLYLLLILFFALACKDVINDPNPHGGIIDDSVLPEINIVVPHPDSSILHLNNLPIRIEFFDSNLSNASLTVAATPPFDLGFEINRSLDEGTTSHVIDTNYQILSSDTVVVQFLAIGKDLAGNTQTASHEVRVVPQ